MLAVDAAGSSAGPVRIVGTGTRNLSCVGWDDPGNDLGDVGWTFAFKEGNAKE